MPITLDNSDDDALAALQRRLDAAGIDPSSGIQLPTAPNTGPAFDAGASAPGSQLQVPVPSGPGSNLLTSDTGVSPAATTAPTAAQDMAEARATQNAARYTDRLGALRQAAQQQRIDVRIGDATAPGGPGLYMPAAVGGFVGGNVAGPAGPSNSPVLDALNRRLSELSSKGGGASSTPTVTTPSGQLGPITQDAIDRQNAARAGLNAPTSPGTVPSSNGADIGQTGAQSPVTITPTGAVVPNPNPNAGSAPTTTPQGATPTTGTPATGIAPQAQIPGNAGAGTGNIGGGAGGTPSGGAIDMGGFLGQLNDIQKAINGNTPSDATAVYVSGLRSILDMLNQQEQSLRADAANGKVIDPQTQQALDALTKNLTGQLQHTQEELNRRGLYSSGILLDLENKLRTGNASDQANLLNDRLARLQSDLQKQLGTLNQNRFSAANNFYAKGAEAQTSADEMTRKIRAELVGQRMQQIAADQAAQAQRAFQERQQATQLAAQRQNEEANRQNAIALEQMRQAAAARTAATARAGGGGGTVAARGNGAAMTPSTVVNGYGTPGGTRVTGPGTGNIDPAVTNSMIQTALGNLRSTSNGTNAPAILEDLYANAAALRSHGVDVQAVEDAITRAADLGADYTRGNRTVGGPI